MRYTPVLLGLLLAGCSSNHHNRPVRHYSPHGDVVFVDTDGDGLPDQRLVLQPHERYLGPAIMVDEDGDGLPDGILGTPSSQDQPDRVALIDTDGDGSPDKLVPTRPLATTPRVATEQHGFGFTAFGQATFADSDDDGLPDARLPNFNQPVQPSQAPLRAALEQLEAAIAEVRRNLR